MEDVNDQISFHGGCHGCDMQKRAGLGACVGCCFFEGNFSLPNLNPKANQRQDDLDEARKKARTMAAGLNPEPKPEKLSLDEQLEIALDAEDYEEAARIRDIMNNPLKQQLDEAIASGNYEEAARLRDLQNK